MGWLLSFRLPAATRSAPQLPMPAHSTHPLPAAVVVVDMPTAIGTNHESRQAEGETTSGGTYWLRRFVLNRVFHLSAGELVRFRTNSLL